MKRKASYTQKHRKEELNKKAIIWTASLTGAFVILMIVLLIFFSR